MNFSAVTIFFGQGSITPTLTLTLLKYPYPNLNLTLIQKLKLSVKLDSYSDFRRLNKFSTSCRVQQMHDTGILKYHCLRCLRTQC